MDVQKIIDVVGGIVKNLGGVKAVPVVGDAVFSAQKLVDDVEAKADAVGLGGVADNLINNAEKKVGMDLDGDGDTGVN